MEDKEIREWKQKYNEFLIRHFKAAAMDSEGYFKDMKSFEKWQPKYQEILNELNYILSLFDVEKVKYSFDEQMGGFNLEG